jgi:uncharacterized SAM-binding protein YcdF (DUF218 family)
MRKILAVVLLGPLLYAGWIAAGILNTSRTDERPPSDAIVVMGAAQYNGRPSAVFQARLDHAEELYRERVAPLIVVLGGKRAGDRFTEAQAGAAYLERRLPADKVTGVKAGSTTLESLQLFRGLARDRSIESIVIVSDPLHLARSKRMAEDLGFQVATSPAKIPESVAGRRSGLVQEGLRLVYYQWFKQG